MPFVYELYDYYFGKYVRSHYREKLKYIFSCKVVRERTWKMPRPNEKLVHNALSATYGMDSNRKNVMKLKNITLLIFISILCALILSCASAKNAQYVSIIKAGNFVDFLAKCIDKYDLKTTEEIEKYCKGDYDGRLSIIKKYRINLPLSESEQRLLGLKPPKGFEGDIASSIEWLKEEFTKPLMTIYVHKSNNLGIRNLEIYSLHKEMSAQLFISCVVSKFAAEEGSGHYYLGAAMDKEIEQNGEKTMFYAFFPKGDEKPSSDAEFEWAKPLPTSTYRDFCRKTIKEQYTW